MLMGKNAGRGEEEQSIKEQPQVTWCQKRLLVV
jgi:hypothetical protein